MAMGVSVGLEASPDHDRINPSHHMRTLLAGTPAGLHRFQGCAELLPIGARHADVHTHPLLLACDGDGAQDLGMPGQIKCRQEITHINGTAHNLCGSRCRRHSHLLAFVKFTTCCPNRIPTDQRLNTRQIRLSNNSHLTSERGWANPGGDIEPTSQGLLPCSQIRSVKTDACIQNHRGGESICGEWLGSWSANDQCLL
jgi:hypothetical protein